MNSVSMYVERESTLI